MNLMMKLIGITLSALTLTTPYAQAQLLTATVKGTVIDEHENSVEGAAIILTHELRGETRVTSNAQGAFSTRLLEMGRYSLKVEAENLLMFALAVTVKSPTGTVETDQNFLVGEDQVAPELQVNADKTYVLVVKLVNAEFFKNRRELAELGRYQEAVVAAEQLIKDKEYDKGIEKLQKVIEKKQDEPYLFYLLGVAFFEKTAYDQAIAEFQKVLALKADYQGAAFYLGRIAYERKELPLAIEYFEKEKLIVPEMQEIYQNLGVLYQNLENYTKAAENFEKLLSLTPDNEDLTDKLIFLYEKLGNNDRREQLVAEREQRGKKNPIDYYNLGVEHWKAKDYTKAETYFGKALEADPALADAHKAMAYCLIHDKKNAAALPHLQRYLELKPQAEDASKIKDLVKQIQDAQ